MTNYHVVAGYREVGIQDQDRNVFLARVILVNPSEDLAVLKVDEDFSHLPSLQLGEEEELQIGGKVLVAGYPYGMPFTVTEGTVSSPRQLLEGKHYIQTDAAVNPGNSGGPMFDKEGKLVGVTVSKFKDADNMGFGVRLEAIRSVLESLNVLEDSEANNYHVQCLSCKSLISEKTNYCPSCGARISQDVFEEASLSALGEFCENAIAEMGLNPILTRDGYEGWTFHRGSAEIRLFVYDDKYLFCVSPIALMPQQNVEPLLTFLLSEDFYPAKFGVDGRDIYFTYRLHLDDLNERTAESITQSLIQHMERADELDDYLVNTFGCEFSEYSKRP